METKNYVLTAGEYSDYHIVAVYSSRELAEQYALAVGLSSDDILEVVLDDPGFVYKENDMFEFSVCMDYAGNITYCECGEYKAKVWRAPYVCFENSYNPTEPFRPMFNIIAHDKDVAIKTASEIRAQLVALNRWRKVQIIIDDPDNILVPVEAKAGFMNRISLWLSWPPFDDHYTQEYIQNYFLRPAQEYVHQVRLPHAELIDIGACFTDTGDLKILLKMRGNV